MVCRSGFEGLTGFVRGMPLVRAAVLSAMLSTAAAACEFHTYAPDPTVVEMMLGSDHIVLARPDPSTPGVYRMTEALVGPLLSIELPVAPDRSTTSRLKASPNDAVLVVREDSYGPWTELGYVDASLRSVLDEVIEQRSAWIMGGDEDRFRMFAGLVNHPSEDVRSLALKELDRAPYGLLRKLRIPKIDGLIGDMAAGSEDLRPIRVLLTGLTAPAGGQAALTTALNDAVASDSPYIGAYVTALVELGGRTSADELSRKYLLDDRTSRETAEKIIEAMAIHSQSGSARVRSGVRKTVSNTLLLMPELAAATARQFGARSDWSQSNAIANASQNYPATTVDDIFAVNLYLELAARSGG